MKISKQDVLAVAKLARLELEDDQLDVSTENFNQVLEHISKMAQVKLDPEVSDVAGESKASWREDTLVPGLDFEKFKKVAPSTYERFFLVPKVVKS